MNFTARCRLDWMEESSRQAADSEESSSDEEGPRRVDMDVDSEPAAEETSADSITPDEREVSKVWLWQNW